MVTCYKKNSIVKYRVIYLRTIVTDIVVSITLNFEAEESCFTFPHRLKLDMTQLATQANTEVWYKISQLRDFTKFYDTRGSLHYRLLLVIQNIWKMRLAVIRLLTIWSLQTFAHATTAQLSSYMQHFWRPLLSGCEGELNEMSIEFKLFWRTP